MHYDVHETSPGWYCSCLSVIVRSSCFVRMVKYVVFPCKLRSAQSGAQTYNPSSLFGGHKGTINKEKEKRQGSKCRRRKVCAFFLDINETKKTSWFQLTLTWFDLCISTNITAYGPAFPQSLWLQAQLQLASLGSRSCHLWGGCAKSFARRPVCFSNRRGGGASTLADPFVLAWHTGSRNTSRMPGHSCAVYPM